ncbi:MAG: nitrous oxide reductase accessory protein NosL [Sulfurovaceae bacterium]|nr:nitrous oxide reductase accessory protein NosL [Sulfurovaceae bacterium]
MFKKLLLLCLLAVSFLNAEPFSKMATTKPVLVQDGAKKMWCGVCGMNLKMFYKTSYIAEDRQYCSIRCLLVDMSKNPIKLDEVKVIDAKTERPIIAKDAFFVIGSDIKGTMSKVSKLAFAKKSDAQDFIKEYGGKLVDFKTVLKEAKASLFSDSAMVGMKKKKMMYPMGKKLLAKKCQWDIDPNRFSTINELKSEIKIKNICKDINEKQLQAVTIYLWDINRTKKDTTIHDVISVKKGDRCPVCGMFVYKYPRWVAQIVYIDNKKFSFDGVKDLMKFYLNINKYDTNDILLKYNIAKILVTDYYSQKVIDGTKAYFVIGSDVTGPMGNEFIPFAQESDAKTFMSDHNGKAIVTFDKISENIIDNM